MRALSSKTFLTALLALLLLGVLVTQDSPWHDHGAALQDCALCHLQASETMLPSAAPSLPAAADPTVVRREIPISQGAARISPYRGRAPPSIS